MDPVIAELEFDIYDFKEDEEVLTAGTNANGVLKIKPIDQGLRFLLKRMYKTAGPDAATADTDFTRMITVPASVTENGNMTLRFSLAGHPLAPMQTKKKKKKRRLK